MEKNYCNNCGNYGHTYKLCRHPVLSYGIILFNKDEDGLYRIVMVERKDSISFIEFIRGKYKINNIEYLNLLFSRLSTNETLKLRDNNFETLWNKLWIHTETINDRIKREYKRSLELFNHLKIREGNNLCDLIKNIKTDYLHNEWEIPKGRRKKHETNKECAIREFNEETNIDTSMYRFFNNIIPLYEEYTGINNVKYKHIYYLAYSDTLYNLKIDQLNKDQYTEIKDIQWLTEEECLQLIRDHDITKRDLIKKLFTFLKNYETHINVIL